MRYGVILSRGDTGKRGGSKWLQDQPRDMPDAQFVPRVLGIPLNLLLTVPSGLP